MAIAGGLSLLGGLSAQKAAKKTQRLNIITAQHKMKMDAAAIESARKHNTLVANKLLREKEVTTEHTKGSVTNTASSVGYSQNSVDIKGMMAAAEAAGFNPVTFLRNGGLQAYLRNDNGTHSTSTDATDLTVTTTRKGHNAVAAYQMKLEQPYLMEAPTITHVPGTGEVLAKAGQAAFSQYNDDRIRQGAQDFQRELLNTQLAAIQQPGASTGSRSFYVPGFSTSGSTITNNTQGGLSSTPFEKKAATLTNPFLRAKVDPGYSDAEAIETRYGDVAQEVGGLRNLIADGLYNATGLTGDQRNAKLSSWLRAGGEFFGGLSFDKKVGDFRPAPMNFTPF